MGKSMALSRAKLTLLLVASIPFRWRLCQQCLSILSGEPVQRTDLSRLCEPRRVRCCKRQLRSERLPIAIKLPIIVLRLNEYMRLWPLALYHGRARSAL